MLKLVVNNDTNNEPRVLDTDLAEALGFERPRAIRELIERNLDELKSYGNLPYHTAKTGKRGRPSAAYHLNEAQGLLVCTFSRTPVAASVRKRLIETFQAYQKGHLELSDTGKVALPNFANPAEAARAWAEVWEQSQKDREVVKDHIEYLTVYEFGALNHRYLSSSDRGKISHHAKAFCEAHQLEVRKQHQPYDTGSKVVDKLLNVYPLEALQYAAERLGLDLRVLDHVKAA